MDSSAESEENLEGPTPRTESQKAWSVGSCTAMSENNHSVFVAKPALELFRNGDVLYTFTPDGICAGKSDPFADKDKNFALAAWGDDSMTEAKEGFVTGEEIVWVITSSRFKQPVRVFVTEVTGPVRYGPDGITVIRDLARK